MKVEGWGCSGTDDDALTHCRFGVLSGTPDQ